MKLYGILYEDLAGDTGSSVGNILYKTPYAANGACAAVACNVCDELNVCGDGEFGPWTTESRSNGDVLVAVSIRNKNNIPVEVFSVVEFTVSD